MSKNAMAGAVTLCGVGLCMIGGAMLMQSGGQAHAAQSSLPAAAAAVSSVASAQAGSEPTVVWYGADTVVVNSTGPIVHTVTRAWSDGRIEARRGMNWPNYSPCNPGFECQTAWFTVSDPNTGYRAAADINADEIINGADLASVLGNWGDAPRVPFPPSDCPLNLINP
jgi:hypothetical protein